VSSPSGDRVGGPEDTAPDIVAPGKTRPYDPERGLRGVMSATLVLEAVVVLLSIPVAKNTGSGTSALGVILICILAVALIALCAFAGKSWFVPAALSLQGLMILGWLITPSLGIMGVVFGLVWGLIIWFRNEFRRRLAAGTLPGPTPSAGGPA
jgi:hypothetical protein